MSIKRPFLSLYPGYFQTAYLTNDHERALESLGKAHGIRDWFVKPAHSFHTRNGKSVTIRLALAFKGDSQIELIQPLEGDTGFYNTAIDAANSDFQLRMHHLCRAFDTPEQYAAQFVRVQEDGVDLPVVITLDVNGGVALACYADYRVRCGHFIEYVWFSKAGRQWMGSVPRNDEVFESQTKTHPQS